jgi:hypothetical protein
MVGYQETEFGFDVLDPEDYRELNREFLRREIPEGPTELSSELFPSELEVGSQTRPRNRRCMR